MFPSTDVTVTERASMYSADHAWQNFLVHRASIFTNRSVAPGGALGVVAAGVGAARVAGLRPHRHAVVAQPVAQRTEGRPRRRDGTRSRPGSGGGW